MNLLTILVALPAVGALVVVSLRDRDRLAVQVALGFCGLALVASLVVAGRFALGGAQYQQSETLEWVPQFGVSWALSVDGIALALVLLTTLVTPIVVWAGRDDASSGGRSRSGMLGWLLLLEAMLLGAFLAVDVLLFYVLFEAMLVPMYFLIGVYGGPRRQYAAVKFLLYNLFGGLVMLAAVIGLYVQSMQGGRAGTFALPALVGLDIPYATQVWLFIGFMLAFAIKAPLWPFHTWLPDAVSEATPAQAGYLSGVMDKVGTFGMLHLVLPLFPDASRELAPVVIVLAVVSILYGALLAIGQSDLRRFVGYTSISHFGLIVLGIFVLTSQGGSGSTFYMVNHGLTTVLLFLVVGWMIARRGSARWQDFGGVQRPAPLLAGVFLFTSMAMLSLPGLSTFVSEFLVLVGTFTRYLPAAVIATLAIVLSAVYMLLLYQRTMTGPVPEHSVGFLDLRGREMVVAAPLIALVLALGIYPQPVLDVINHGVGPTLQQVGVTDPAPVLGPAAAGAEGNAP